MPPPRWNCLRGMPEAGADLIEIGIPFTDPMADGPIVQAAGKRGLKAGVKVAHILTMVREFRRDDAATPIVLMGYLNPILSYEPERFCTDAAASGVDGLIIVDLPTEESDLLVPRRARMVSTSSASSRRPRTTSVCRWYSMAVPASSTTSASPASPAPAVRRRSTWPRRSRASAASPTCPSRWGSACAARTRRRRRCALPMPPWWHLP